MEISSGYLGQWWQNLCQRRWALPGFPFVWPAASSPHPTPGAAGNKRGSVPSAPHPQAAWKSHKGGFSRKRSAVCTWPSSKAQAFASQKQQRGSPKICLCARDSIFSLLGKQLCNSVLPCASKYIFRKHGSYPEFGGCRPRRFGHILWPETLASWLGDSK